MLVNEVLIQLGYVKLDPTSHKCGLLGLCRLLLLAEVHKLVIQSIFQFQMIYNDRSLSYVCNSLNLRKSVTGMCLCAKSIWEVDPQQACMYSHCQIKFDTIARIKEEVQ